jgi:hypothetical protein
MVLIGKQAHRAGRVQLATFLDVDHEELDQAVQVPGFRLDVRDPLNRRRLARL